MNKEKIKKLIGVLDKSETYDQSMFSHECGTPACIAGHACAMEGIELDKAEEDIWIIAKEILGLTFKQSMYLFQASPYFTRRLVEKWEAIKTLQHLLETGDVVWERGP